MWFASAVTGAIHDAKGFGFDVTLTNWGTVKLINIHEQ